MKSVSKTLRIDSILEYYDYPQLLTARDSFDTLYLCLLYDDFPTCQYTAIRISVSKLNDFVSGTTDLRSLFLTPENENEYFDVELIDNQFVLKERAFDSISEYRLPDSGYKMPKSEDESIVVKIPVKDKGLFKELVKKFGWACM